MTKKRTLLHNSIFKKKAIKLFDIGLAREEYEQLESREKEIRANT